VMRTFFTGSFRKPRELTWMVGVAMLALALPEGYAGYSMVDDLLSGMGLAIGYGVGLSIPLLGGPLTVLLFGGPMPGGGVLFSRLFILHVFVMPVAIGSLIALHLILIMRTHHAQFPGPGRRESNVVGTPMWPGYALRSLGLFAATAGALFAVGGLVQINPIWEWGPYEPWLATNGAQPDWYLGWLIGALRLVPGFDVHVWGRTLIPNPFWGGALFPGGLIGLLFVWPWIERWWTRDRAIHHLLDRPRDSPRRTAIGVAVFVLTLVVQVAGSTDRIYFALGIDYQAQIWAFRAALFVAPALAYAITRRICADLRRGGRHPLRGVPGSVVRRNAAGGFDVHDAEPSSDEEVSVDRVT
jgi:quinol---cytochrome-c reductase cytochrome b subunit